MESPQRIRADLTDGMKRRSRPEVATLRTLLAAIQNAEAVADDTDDNLPAVGAHASDQPRRRLSPSDIDDILKSEVSERLTTIAQYQDLGVDDRIDALRDEIAIVSRYLD